MLGLTSPRHTSTLPTPAVCFAQRAVIPGRLAAAQPDASAESKIVTFEQKVAMNFEQWPHVPDEWEPPTNAEWARDGDY